MGYWPVLTPYWPVLKSTVAGFPGTQLLVGGSNGATVQQGAGMSAFPGRNFMSRKFTILFLTATFLVALATLALTPHVAKADSRVNSELENVNGGALGGPKKTSPSGGTKKQFQSTTVNTSRSNIKNNMGVAPRMGGGGGGRTK
jgi:hypothetical protein